MMFLYSFINATLIMTPIIVLLLLLTPLLDKIFAVSGRYWLWLLVTISLFLPFASLLPPSVAKILPSNNYMLSINLPVPVVNSGSKVYTYAPENEQPSAYASEQESEQYIAAADNHSSKFESKRLIDMEQHSALEKLSTPGNHLTSASDSERPSPIEPARQREWPELNASLIILAVWLAGAAICSLRHSGAYIGIKRFIRRWGMPVTDDNVIRLFDAEKLRIGSGENVRLMTCKSLASPMLIGIFRPMLILPDLPFSNKDILYILRHELTHYKRRDLWYKLALTALKSLYWFNPVVHLMAAQANRDIEIMCDMLTVRGFNIAMRKRYSEIILKMSAVGCSYGSQLTTYFSGGKNMLKNRFSNILGSTKKNGAAAFVAIGMSIVAAITMIGFNFAPESAAATVNASDSVVEDTAKDSVILQDLINDARMKLISGLNDFVVENPEMKSIEELQSQISEELYDLTSDLNDLLNETFGSAKFQELEKQLNDEIQRLTSELNIILNEALDSKTMNDLNELQKQVVEHAQNLKSEIDDHVLNGFNYDRTGFLIKANVYESIDELREVLYDGAQMTEHEFDNISEVYINTVYDQVKLSRGGDKLYIRYYEHFENQYTLKTEDGGLMLTSNNPPKLIEGKSISDSWFWDFIVSFEYDYTKAVEMVIPESMELNAIFIDTASGPIRLSDMAFAGELYIDTASGEIIIENCDFTSDNRLLIDTASGKVNVSESVFAGELAIDAASGIIDISDSKINGELSIDTASGRVNLKAVEISGNMGADTTNGDINIYDSKITGDLIADTINGTINLESTVTGGVISIDGVNGQINVKDSAFESISLSSYNGNIKLELPESADNYDIKSNSNGERGLVMYNNKRTDKANLRNDSECKVNLSTYNGSIRITDN